MDANGLQQLFSQSNPFLAQMGEQSFNQDQATKQQTLADLVQKNMQSAQLQPGMLQKQLDDSGHTQELTRQSKVTSDATDYATKAKPPIAEAMAAAMSKLHAGMSEDNRKTEDTTMYKRLQLASMAQANGGVLPLNVSSSIPEEERQYFASPQAVVLTLKMGKAYHDSHPATMEARAKEAANLERTKELANATRYAADQRLSGVEARIGAGGAGRSPKNPREESTHYQILANAAVPGSAEQKQYQALADSAWAAVEREIILRASAAQGGKVDPAATVKSGGVQAFPPQQPGGRPAPAKEWTPPPGWK